MTYGASRAMIAGRAAASFDQYGDRIDLLVEIVTRVF
jgi:hypothetical protein